MTARLGRTILAISGVACLASTPSSARAQGNTFNPYGNSGYADYREFGQPMYSNNPALPGQSRLDGEPLVTRPRANSYRQYTDSLESDSRGGGSNLPYYEAYRRHNSQNNRNVYRPNDTPENRKFEERMKARDAAYAKYLDERDPVKRRELLRKMQQGTLATPRAAAGATTAPRTAAPRASATAPPPPGETRNTPKSTAPAARSTAPAARSTAPAAPATTTQPRSAAPAAPAGPAPDPSTVPIPPPR